MRHAPLMALYLVVGTWLAVPAVAHACSCSPPLLSSAANARASDIVFVGTITRLESPAGWSRVKFESLQVVAVGDGGRFVTSTDTKSSYQLVLPPGDFEIWVGRAGQRVSAVEKVRVTANLDHHLMVAASF